MSRLVSIANTTKADRQGDVVFVHGLGGDARGTWTDDRTKVFWPDNLGADLPEVGIWSLGYEASPSAWLAQGRTMPLTDRATNALEQLAVRGLGERPLVFITHSLGGLVVKWMLRLVSDSNEARWKPILEQTRGVVFLGTPHSGADMASWLQALGVILRLTVSVEDLRAHNPQLRDLSQWYRDNAPRNGIATLNYFETRDTHGVRAVNETTADSGLGRPIPVDTDHLEICRISDPEDMRYLGIKQFIEKEFVPIPPLHVPPSKDGPVEDRDSRVSFRIKINLPQISGICLGRENQLKRLDEAWETSSEKVISIIGEGGQGKTSLIQRWLLNKAKSNYANIASVFVWTFYSQGVNSDAANADKFIFEALNFFGDPSPDKGGVRERGERLADLVGKEESLLILDGIEPLLFPPSDPVEGGKLKEPGLASLLIRLMYQNAGLCVITSRVKIKELEVGVDTTAPMIILPRLSPESGADLLRLKVNGKRSELEDLSKKYGGHPLAISLLGNYIYDVYGGNLKRSTMVVLIDQDQASGRHVQHMLHAYALWFSGEKLSDKNISLERRADIRANGERMLAVLRILGLFDRPADRTLFEGLCGEAIPDLNDGLIGLIPSEIERTLSRLRTSGLLYEDNGHLPSALSRQSLDCHPLIREYFSSRLLENSPSAWKRGHYLLYKQLIAQLPSGLPKSREHADVLYQAIQHLCKSGEYVQAYRLYRERITDNDWGYTTRTFGMFAAEFGLLRHFFIFEWNDPVGQLNATEQIIILRSMGFCLWPLERYRDAAILMLRALELSKNNLDHDGYPDAYNAAITARNLANLYLSVGSLKEAIQVLRENYAFADATTDDFMRVGFRCTLGYALLQAEGPTSECERLFNEALEYQRLRKIDQTRDDSPLFTVLGQLPGFHYWEYLNAAGRHEEVTLFANQATIESPSKAGIMSQGLELLSKAISAAGQKKNRIEVTAQFEQAVSVLKSSGRREQYCRAFIAYADYLADIQDWESASVWLEQAEQIAFPDGLKLYSTDCKILRIRMLLSSERMQLDEVKKYLVEVESLVEETGYHRRDSDIQPLRERLQSLI